MYGRYIIDTNIRPNTDMRGSSIQPNMGMRGSSLRPNTGMCGSTIQPNTVMSGTVFHVLWLARIFIKQTEETRLIIERKNSTTNPP